MKLLALLALVLLALSACAAPPNPSRLVMVCQAMAAEDDTPALLCVQIEPKSEAK